MPFNTTSGIGQEMSHGRFSTGPILGVCVCHPGSKEGLKVWLGALQEAYPSLGKATVVYNIREGPPGDQERIEAGERAQLLDGDRQNV